MMKKKLLIAMSVLMLGAVSYWGYHQYQRYEAERVRQLIKERDAQIRRDLIRMQEDAIRQVEEARKRQAQEAEEEQARQARIASGNPIIEEVITYYPDSTQKKEQYTLVEGKKEGRFRSWYPSGQLNIEEYYKNDVLHGEGIFWRESGVMLSKDNYVNGKLDGLSQRYHTKGELYKLEHYVQDQRHGRVQRFNEDGESIYEATFEHGLLEGPVFGKEKTGGMRYAEFSKGMLLREETFYGTGEKRSLEIYLPEQDLIQATYWYPNGQVSFEGYKRQPLQERLELIPAGTYHYYRETGEKFLELPYQNTGSMNGFSLGTCYRWDIDGNIITQVEQDDYQGWRHDKVIKGDRDHCRLSSDEDEKIFKIGYIY